MLLLTLAACDSVEDTVAIGPATAMLPETLPEACDLAAAAPLIGQPFTALATHSAPPGGLRVIREGQMITADLAPDRLNVQVNANGRILRMFCG